MYVCTYIYIYIYTYTHITTNNDNNDNIDNNDNDSDSSPVDFIWEGGFLLIRRYYKRVASHYLQSSLCCSDCRTTLDSTDTL